MCGRALSLLLTLLLTTIPLAADCNWTLRYSGEFRATVFDVVVDGEGIVWLATGYGLQLLEPVTGRGYAIVGSLPIPGSTRVIALNGILAYVGSGSRLYVVRRDGHKLTIVSSMDAGGTVNDIALVTSYLFVATSNSIAHYFLFDATHPERSSVVLFTSRPNVTSLTVSGTTVYAADGDSSVERFLGANTTLPQGTTPLDSLARASAVHTMPNNNVIVSDELGQNSDIFAPNSTTKIGRIAYGTNAYAALTTDSFFAAGPQRTFRAVDTTTIARVAELYAQQLQAVGGTSNRIFAMTRSGNTLLVAAGDMGLFSYEIAGLAPPRPLVSYSEGAKGSALTIGDRAFYADSAGIAEAAIIRSGISLSPVRSWTTPSPTLHDTTATSLLASSTAEVRIWSVEGQTPTTTFTATMPANVRSAVVTSNAVFANLVDNSVWRAALAGGAPTQVDAGAPVHAIARSSANVIFATITDDANTVLRYYANGDTTASPRVFNLDGVATGGVALNSTSAAIFTFRGLSVIDLASGAVRVLPSSNRTIPKQLLFSGTDLLVLGDPSTLAVWNTTNNTLLREHPLPASPQRMNVANGVAVIASSAGSMAIAYNGTLPKPSAINGNRFYKKAAAAGDYLYLFDDHVDVYWTAKGAAPTFINNIAAPGTIDIAALPQTLFALGAFGTVTAYSTAGAPIAQTTINEGPDAQPLAIATVGNAVWVAFEKGCSSGTCERKTLVLDPQSLTITATMTGGFKRVVTNSTATRAYALFSTPYDMRVINILNPLQPSQIMSAASPANATDIAFAGGTVYVIADKVYAYNEAFVQSGEFLSASTAPANMSIEDSCAVVTGRAENPQLYSTVGWVASPTQIAAPSSVRVLAQQPGRLFLLTDHSIEVWTAAPPATGGKKRAAAH